MASGSQRESAESREGGGMATASDGCQSASPSTVNIFSAKNVYISHQQAVNVADGPQFASGVTGRSPMQDLCPESLVVALLKEILFHCPRKREALYTLENKLCEKLCELKGNHIVSFQEHFQISFRDFLGKYAEHFEVFSHGNELIVSRAAVRCAPSDSGSFSVQQQPIPSRVQQTEPPRMKIDASQRKPVAETVEDFSETERHPQGIPPKTAAAEIHHKGHTETPRVCPEKAQSAHEHPISVETHGGLLKTRAPGKKISDIDRFLWTKPSDTLVFQVSDEGYTENSVQFTVDVVSLWNTPHRDRAFVVLGVKPLARLPHQVVGLKYSRRPDFYKKAFLWSMFDFPPRFTYWEARHKGKVVGVVQVESSAGCGQSCVVNSDVMKPKLKRNQLWLRKAGKNITVSGSDMNNELVCSTYSWFMLSPGSPPHEHPTAPSSTGIDSLVKVTELHEQSVSRNTTPPQQGSVSLRGSESTLTSLEPDDEGHKTISRPIAQSGADSSAGKKPPSELLRAVRCFKHGHYVLLCGTLSHTTPNLDALSLVPWLMVYDFDVNGRDTGLLAYLEQGLRDRRSMTVHTWQDPHTALTERGTQWWSLRGRLDLPDSNLSALSPIKWLQKVSGKLDKVCKELARLSQDYTVLSFVVLWPASREEVKCLSKTLTELHKHIHVQPLVFLCFTESPTDDDNSHIIESIKEDCDGSVWMGVVDLEELCTEVAATFSSDVASGKPMLQLPGGEAMVDINLDKAAWLSQDFEVLYLHSLYMHREVTSQDLQAEGDNFFRGGSLSWLVRYDMGATCFDIERCDSRGITQCVREHIDKFRGGIIRILHAPGSGGSTMAQRVLFELHETTPCVHIRQRSGSTVEDVVARLQYLADTTHMPVVALMDGEEDQKLQLLHTQLGHRAVIFLHIKRYPYRINNVSLLQKHRNIFHIQGFVTKKESRNLVVRFDNHCKNTEKKQALKTLDQGVQNGYQRHQMFEYGMTVFDYEFQGVHAYVKGYLQLAEQRIPQLEPYQSCLGYLALVYYYAQIPLPCCFLGKIIGGSQEPVLDISDLPHCVQMLVVPDVNEGRSSFVRVMHYTVAKEILEQILNPTGQACSSEHLSAAAKQNLKSFCLNFLSQVVSGDSSVSFTLQSLLTKTFILRDITEMSDADSDTEVRKKPQFSAILLDLDSEAPFDGRLQVLQRLCDICPEDASLRAHLGRFYSLCRPGEEEKAEQYFSEAVRLATESEEQDMGSHQRADLAYIYHMYGCFLRRRMNRKFSAISGSTLLQDIIQDAEQACQKFSSCRYYAPPAQMAAHQYFGEMDVRLQACRFLGHCVPGGLPALLDPRQTTGMDAERGFIRTCIVELQDLVTECANRLLLDDATLAELHHRVSSFNTIFRHVTQQLQNLAEEDPVTCLRLKITAKKLEYAFGDKVVSAENPKMPAEVMSFVVDSLEQIFLQQSRCRTIQDKLELDYRDWMLAIRHPNFPKTYTLERVMEEVRHWSHSVEGPQSLASFYLFVLTSLQGFGTATSAGHERCVAEARALKEKVQKQSRLDPKARLPREWLGKGDHSGIRRLVSQGYVPMENHRVKGTAQVLLAVCKGTVKGKVRKSSGFINLDLHHAGGKDAGSRCCMDVFFVPAHTVKGELFLKGTRVQFYLAFTQEHGYQAHEVTRLERSKCSTCGLWVEITRDEGSVRCPGKTMHGKSCSTRIYKETC